MSQTACKFIRLLISCTLLFVCVTGCGNSDEKKYRSLFEKGIVIDNNITMVEQNEEDEQDENSQSSYYKIDGLKDQEVEKKINDKINATAERMYSSDYIPPYRGISLKMKQYRDLDQSVRVYIFSQFNSNHILCIRAVCSTSFSGDDEYFEFSYSVPLNFDLSTGNELTLKDVFEPGADYIEIVNRSVDKYSMSHGFDNPENEYTGSTQISLVSPFKSIKPEQKFFIDSEGDLMLCLDYDTPEFYTGYSELMLSLDSESMGSAYRPYKVAKTPLFESERINCRFMCSYDYKQDERTDYSDPSNTFYAHLKYPADTPEAIMNRVFSFTYDQTQFPISKKEFKKYARKKLGKKFNVSSDITTDCSTVKYKELYSFRRYCYFSANTFDVEDLNDLVCGVSYYTSYCFDSDGQPVDLHSLFITPDKADHLLMNAIIQNVNMQAVENYTTVDGSEQKLRALLKELFKHIDGFSVNAYGFNLSYDLSSDQIKKIANKHHVIVDNDAFEISQWVSYASYSDIGCENLLFFHEAFE